MANNGRLVPHERGFRGVIATLAFKADVMLAPNGRHQSSDPNSPKYVVEAKGSHGDFVEIGAAWEKVIERGAHAGEKFLSITVDDPSLAGPLNMSAFLREGGAFDVTWSRPRPDGREFKPDQGRAA
ncbi:MAG TPA: DUF736 domain-containing protein [Stellaceae bacterium]|nr:DUF736 domain-containing protein [Stellaceae bacterium]